MVEFHKQNDATVSGKFIDESHQPLVSNKDWADFNKCMKMSKPAAGDNGVVEFNNPYQSDTKIAKPGAKSSNEDNVRLDKKLAELDRWGDKGTFDKKYVPNPAADGGKPAGDKPNGAADGGIKDNVGKPNHAADSIGKPNRAADGEIKESIGKPNPAADGDSNENHKAEGSKNGGAKENFNPPATGRDNPASTDRSDEEYRSFQDQSASATNVRENFGNVTLASAQPQPLQGPWTVHGDGTVTRGTTKSQPAQS